MQANALLGYYKRIVGAGIARPHPKPVVDVGFNFNRRGEGAIAAVIFQRVKEIVYGAANVAPLQCNRIALPKIGVGINVEIIAFGLASF